MDDLDVDKDYPDEVMEKYAEQCIQIIDENGDNLISLDEFTTWWMAGSKGIHGFLRNSFLTTCNMKQKIE